MGPLLTVEQRVPMGDPLLRLGRLVEPASSVVGRSRLRHEESVVYDGLEGGVTS